MCAEHSSHMDEIIIRLANIVDSVNVPSVGLLATGRCFAHCLNVSRHSLRGLVVG